MASNRASGSGAAAAVGTTAVEAGGSSAGGSKGRASAHKSKATASNWMGAESFVAQVGGWVSSRCRVQP